VVPGVIVVDCAQDFADFIAASNLSNPDSPRYISLAAVAAWIDDQVNFPPFSQNGNNPRDTYGYRQFARICPQTAFVSTPYYVVGFLGFSGVVPLP